LRREGFQINHKRVERIWREEGLKVPKRQPRRRRLWLKRLGVQTLFIEPGSPWENGYNESFNGNFRDELLNGEIFYTLKEAQVLIEEWRLEYNTVRPHSSLKYRPPATEAWLH
jgi:transposase InsO family protein